MYFCCDIIPVLFSLLVLLFPSSFYSLSPHNPLPPSPNRQILTEAKDNIRTVPGGETVADVVVGVNSAIGDALAGTGGGGGGAREEEVGGYVDLSHGSIQSQPGW